MRKVVWQLNTRGWRAASQRIPLFVKKELEKDYREHKERAANEILLLGKSGQRRYLGWKELLQKPNALYHFQGRWISPRLRRVRNQCHWKDKGVDLNEIANSLTGLGRSMGNFCRETWLFLQVTFQKSRYEKALIHLWRRYGLTWRQR